MASPVKKETSIGSAETLDIAQDIVSQQIPSADVPDTPSTKPDSFQFNSENRSERSRTSVFSKTMSSVSDITNTYSTALAFCKEVLIRLIPVILLLGFVGWCAGYLVYWAAKHLLTMHAESNSPWQQIWSEHRDREIEEMLMNSTYVQIYDPIHREVEEDPHAPKLGTRWIFAYYIRMMVVAWIAYGIPWFILFTLIGWQRLRRWALSCLLPQLLLVMGYCFAAACYLDFTGKLLVSDLIERSAGFLMAAAEAFVVLPICCRFIGIKHPWKAIILPYLVQWLALMVLRYQVPLYVVSLTNPWNKVVFRVVVYEIMKEVFVGATRMILRLIPLSDGDEVRPEDKTFVLLGCDCLFGYWGRIIIMDLNDTAASAVCSLALALAEFASRVSVVHRDRLYLAVMFQSSGKRSEFWSTNAAAMKRFRCSTVYMHAILEYLMITAAFSFSWASGMTRDKDMGSLVVNLVIQVLSEVMCDGLTFYVELFKHKLPIISAWNSRHRTWFFLFVVFTVGFNLFAISQSGEYFCALRNPDNQKVILTYCGGAK